MRGSTVRPETSELLGTKVGHIRIVDVIGEGGMGAVYAGFDDTLQRKVAVKAIRKEFRLDPDAKARFLREARILSQLDQPLICTVHDFIAGDDVDFLVMELVEGRSLRSALAEPLERELSLGIARQLLEVLVTVHARGVVHRDLKPENVMLGPSGGIKVLDFGLARSIEGEVTLSLPRTGASDPPRSSAGAEQALDADTAVTTADTPPAGDNISTQGQRFSTLRTRAGSIVGTAGYMSPEQARAETVTAASDVYSFGLVLQEMLTGARPFDPAPAEVLLERAADGESLAPVGLPPELTSLIGRLKARDPGDRPTAAEARRELDWIMSAPQRRRRRLQLWGTVVLAALAIIGSVYGVWQHRSRRARLCSGGQQRVAAVWHEARRQSLRESFVATGAAFAEGALTDVVGFLDPYLERWGQVYTEACEATRIRGERSDDLLDRQMACLEQRLRELDALLELLDHADLEGVASAHDAVRGLRSVEACADTAGLTAEVPLPSDPRLQQRIETMRETLAEAQALEQLGHYAEASERFASLIDTAEGVGYAPLLAEALIGRGSLEINLDQQEAAAATLRRAWIQAERGGSDRLAAHAAEQLAWLDAKLADLERGRWWCELGLTKLERIGAAPKIEADLLTALGQIQMQAGEYEAAHATQLEAYEIVMREYGEESPDGARAHAQMADTLSFLGRYEEALPHVQRALAITERILGPRHPLAATYRSDLGYAYIYLRRFDEAIEELETALAIREESLGVRHPEYASSLNNLASALENSERYEEALAVYDRSLELKRETLGIDHPDYVITLLNRCGVLRALGRLDEAIEGARKAAAGFERSLGAEHPYVGYAVNNLGAFLRDAGRPSEAIPHLRRAIAIGSEDPLAMGRRQASLAQALIAAGRDRQRASQLVEEARQSFQAAGDRGSEDLAKLEEWAGENLGS